MFDDDGNFQGSSGSVDNRLYDEETFQKVSAELAEKVPNVPKPKAPPKQVQKTEPAKEEPEIVSEPEEEIPREFSETEKEAQRYGWDPRGEKSAEEWMRARPLYQEIKDSHKKIKSQDLIIQQMSATLNELKKRADDAEIARLTALRNQAIQQRDVAAVDKVDEELNKFRFQPVTEPPQEHSPSVRQLYGEDAELRSKFEAKHAEVINAAKYGNEIGKFLLERSSQLDAQQLPVQYHLDILEHEMHKKFPHYRTSYKEESAERSSPTKVSSDEAKTRTNASYSKGFENLSKEQKEVALYLERKGHMKREDYLKIAKELTR